MKKILPIYRTLNRKFLFILSTIRKWKLKITQNITIPKTTYIGPGCQISGSGFNIRIGENTTLVSNIKLDGPIIIGNNVIFAPNCTVIARNHDYFEGDALPYGTGYIYKSITISDNVWVGSNVSIVPGVTIEEGAIIGMGSVVTKNVPKCACVGGNPASIIGGRDEKHYLRLINEHKYLNNIRGNYIQRRDLIKKEKSLFCENIREKGYMVNAELSNIDEIFRSYVLYELHQLFKGTYFGNAGRFHIAIRVDLKDNVNQIAVDIGKNFDSITPIEVIISDLQKLYY
jgi:acetyltransferase-like isoleucine patch superfamily enzyme